MKTAIDVRVSTNDHTTEKQATVSLRAFSLDPRRPEVRRPPPPSSAVSFLVPCTLATRLRAGGSGEDHSQFDRLRLTLHQENEGIPQGKMMNLHKGWS
jgi:hypothetical protein